MRWLFVLLGLLPLFGLTQKLSQANICFDRYEYERAAAIYDSCAAKKPLPLEEFKRQAYSFYVIGNYDRCFELTDSLIRLNSTEPFFHYAHAHSCMARSEYSSAKMSFERYRSMDNEFEVDIQIASCDSLLIWQPAKIKGLKKESQNHSKANINGVKQHHLTFAFHETGIDSSGAMMELSQIDFSEVVLSKPYVRINDSLWQPIQLPDNYRLATITSLAWLKSLGQVVMTIAEPVAEIAEKHAPHLYTGTFNVENYSITDIEPFLYSGWQDSSSCAYATVNDSENTMVFTRLKSGQSFSDLFITKLSDGSWSNPIPIDELNTLRDEFAPMFSGDSLLSFSSDGRPGYGDLDIFTVKVSKDGFGPIQHLKAPYNSFHDDFNFSYLADSVAWFTSNKTAGKGDDDIYMVELDVIRPVVKIDSSSIYLALFENNWRDIKIYFNFNKFDLTDKGKIDSIVKNLQLFPECSLTIEGHTDSKGTVEFNKDLGFLRADAVKKELISLGVSEKQLTILTKGETDPQVLCENCSPEQHALNRVAIVKLVVNRKEQL